MNLNTSYCISVSKSGPEVAGVLKAVIGDTSQVAGKEATPKKSSKGRKRKLSRQQSSLSSASASATTGSEGTSNAEVLEKIQKIEQEVKTVGTLVSQVYQKVSLGVEASPVEPQVVEKIVYKFPEQGDSEKCTICKRVFASVAACKKHFDNIHLGKGTGFQCTVCERNLTTAYNLKRHMSTHEKNKNVVCPKCNEGFSSKSNLQRHMDNCGFLCPHCHVQVAGNSHAINKHIKRCSGATKEYRCQVEGCTEVFEKKKHLKSHVLEKHSSD